MKNLLMLTVAMFIACAAYSQQYEVKKSSGFRFDVESGVETESVLTVEGQQFKIFETDKGTKYVKCISKAGKPYPVWVGTDTGDRFEDKAVYRSKSGSHCIFTLNKNGYPYPVWLTKQPEKLVKK
jgi:hypothetical protein